MLKYMESTDNKQLTELSDEDLKQVNGGFFGLAWIIECDATECKKLGMTTDPETCECI